MGITVVNVLGLAPHAQPAWSENDYTIAQHQTDIDVDTRSPVFSANAAAAIKYQAINGSQAAFDAACEAATGSGWWNDQSRTSEYKATLKAVIARAV